MPRTVEKSLHHQEGMPPFYNGAELFSIPGRAQAIKQYESNLAQRFPDVFQKDSGPNTGQRALPLLLQPNRHLRGAAPSKESRQDSVQ